MKFANKLIRYKEKGKILFLIFICLLFSQCVEEFDFETEDFESILVVNTTVTNEVKRQQVLLSRTFKFEDNGPLLETGATVKIIEENTAIEYLFEEVSSGTYLSIQEFAAMPDNKYQLVISTTDGRSYISEKVMLPNEISMDRVYPERMSNTRGVEGVGILIDTFDPTGTSKYYRYKFEETYRITAPFWTSQDVVIISGEEDCIYDFVERPMDRRACYANNFSNTIIITNTTAFNEDRLTGFLLNFLPSDDIRVVDRYSILVKQFVQSKEANGFYQILKDFSESESLFSQVQPGFIEGNIISESNKDEIVLGFFDVSSVSERRIFFNSNDVIDGLPKFDFDCEIIVPVLDAENEETPEEFEQRWIRIAGDRSNKFVSKELTGEPEPPDECKSSIDGFTFVTPRACGDCTAFGRSEVPDFWEN
ncbi:DUF4249 domain-containing protein [Aquimarina algiphila]|uniref:DUF4249 domain-containing protein n=1 Tax=Aquimarina algiphila TaxID=2047982 RepID=UPI002330B07B|nr:DUF4249 domain-containing protein [Aquimarina algiphila]